MIPEPNTQQLADYAVTEAALETSWRMRIQ
jgi:hypothetical protein